MKVNDKIEIIIKVKQDLISGSHINVTKEQVKWCTSSLKNPSSYKKVSLQWRRAEISQYHQHRQELCTAPTNINTDENA